LLSLLTEFDNAECKFNVKFKRNQATEFKVDIYKQIGNPRTNVQIVYSNELNDITKTESRVEFVTAIQGEGGTPTKNPDGSDIVTGTNPDGTTIETPKITFADIER
jgi:phage minor structural protein